MMRAAVISECGTFRYHLSRAWSQRPRLLLVMLNPSTADAEVDDATIRRCCAVARQRGAGGIEVVNLYAYRATDPADLRRAGWPVGPLNDQWTSDTVTEVVRRGGEVVAAWGGAASGLDRPLFVRALLRHLGARTVCFGLTRGGHPRHPLYLPTSTPLVTLP